MWTKNFLWNLRRYVSYLSGIEKKRTLCFRKKKFFKWKKNDSCENQVGRCLCDALSGGPVLASWQEVSQSREYPHPRCSSKEKEYYCSFLKLPIALFLIPFLILSRSEVTTFLILSWPSLCFKKKTEFFFPTCISIPSHMLGSLGLFWTSFK